MTTPLGFHEAIRTAHEAGGVLALLGDLYLSNETLRLTNNVEAIRYEEPIAGGDAYYSPAPFSIAESAITQDTTETSMISVHLGIAKWNTDETEFSSAQRARFSQLMYDLDEWLERNDVRGSLAIIRAVNPDDLSADWHLFTGLVDDYTIENDGLTLALADHNDVLDAPTHPISVMCPYQFGETRCGVDADSAANLYTGTAEAGSTTTTIVDSSITPATAGYWNVGIVTATSGSNKNVSREIASYDNATDTVTVSTPFDAAIATGDSFSLRRRCKQTAKYCEDTFNNIINFGGYKYLNEAIQGLYYRGKS